MNIQASNIDKLEVGLDLDMLIAERVMGWKWYHLRAMGGNWINALKSGKVPVDYLPGKTHAEYQAPYDGPRFSTELAAAWQVVEATRKDTFHLVWIAPERFSYFTPEAKISHQWRAAFDTNYVGRGATQELAICRAALAAVGEEE